MSKKKLSKLLALYLPYVVIGLVATNLGEAWRLAVGKELGDKIVSLMDTLPAVFSNPLPSLHPFDLFIGLCCGAGMRLAVYLKGKNAKKYRHGMEYGSARWGGPKDIEPFMAPKFEDNIILTKTERLMMSNRPPDPKNARNKNVLVVGGITDDHHFTVWDTDGNVLRVSREYDKIYAASQGYILVRNGDVKLIDSYENEVAVYEGIPEETEIMAYSFKIWGEQYSERIYFSLMDDENNLVYSVAFNSSTGETSLTTESADNVTIG